MGTKGAARRELARKKRYGGKGRKKSGRLRALACGNLPYPDVKRKEGLAAADGPIDHNQGENRRCEAQKRCGSGP